MDAEGQDGRRRRISEAKGRGPRNLSIAIGFLSISALTGLNVADAGCMLAPTRDLQNLADMAGREPVAVLAATDHDASAGLSKLRMGWRQAARAEAYDTLSRPADARRTTLAMIEQGVGLETPLQFELLTRYAMNGFATEEIDQAFPLLTAARQKQARGSPADACLEIALGEMLRMRGAPERAVVYLAEAYRNTSDPAFNRQHILAAEKLARVMDWAGDHLQAISLIEEVIASDEARGRTVALSTDFYFRGSFNLARGAYPAALTDFQRSREFASSRVDPVGAGFLDLQTCATLIELTALDRAKVVCLRAGRTFNRYGEIAGGQVQLLLARIALAQNDPRLALGILDRLLVKSDVLSSFASAPEAFRLRSEVNDRLGRKQAAYSDLALYVRAMDRLRSSERVRQNAVLRASFNADREAARNEDLRQKLLFSGEREREQAKRYAVLASSAAIGALMLIFIIGMGVFHRRKLTRIANTDSLTGLRNRRFIDGHEKARAAGPAWKEASRALAIIDIDHFKAINDSHGHSVGDEILIAFASLARDVLRTSDVIARWGGEEFIVIFQNATADRAVQALERLKRALETDIETTAGPVAVSFSAGIAVTSAGRDLQSLVRIADEALYRAKAGGRNRIETSDADE